MNVGGILRHARSTVQCAKGVPGATLFNLAELSDVPRACLPLLWCPPLLPVQAQLEEFEATLKASSTDRTALEVRGPSPASAPPGRRHAPGILTLGTSFMPGNVAWEDNGSTVQGSIAFHSMCVS